MFTTRVSGASRLPVPPARIKPFHEVTVWLPDLGRSRTKPSQLVRRDEAAWIGEIPVDGFGEPGFEALCCLPGERILSVRGKLTSPRCPSAWQPNRGIGGTPRCTTR